MRAPDRWVLVVLASMLLAGCLAAPTTDKDRSPTPSEGPAWSLDCEAGRNDAVPEACVALLSPTQSQQREAHIAVDPADAERVLVTWTEVSNTRQVWAAVSTDRGRTWAPTKLIDPGNTDPNPHGGNRYSFDSIAAVGPDGTLLVFYGGEYVQPAGTLLRMTVAKSVDQGATWTYRYVTRDSFAMLWDFMDMAVSPDTGHLHVVAHASTPGIHYWRSEDGGATWTGPDRVFAATTGNARVPRVAAAAGGHVVVSMTVLAGPDPGHSAIRVSHDSGKTWGSTVDMPRPNGAGDPLALRVVDGALEINMVYHTGTYAWHRSRDGGKSWERSVEFGRAPEGMSAIWSASAVDENGTVHVLQTYGSTSAPRWGARIVRLHGGALQGETELVPVVNKMPPRGTGAGDDYGGLSLSPDGSVWAAWSDPRPAANNQIAIVRLVYG